VGGDHGEGDAIDDGVLVVAGDGEAITQIGDSTGVGGATDGTADGTALGEVSVGAAAGATAGAGGAGGRAADGVTAGAGDADTHDEPPVGFGEGTVAAPPPPPARTAGRELAEVLEEGLPVAVAVGSGVTDG
jgi:hypothetical protein